MKTTYVSHSAITISGIRTKRKHFNFNRDVESPETAFLHELEVGKIYEIVVTQACGLYRYRMGDVVQVVGYFGECPRVKFLYR